MKSLPSKRSQTDAALRTERDQTDQKLRDRQKGIAEDADDVVRLARERADMVLQQARERADQEVGDANRATLDATRALEDDAVRSERAEADSQLATERDVRERALRNILGRERAETDSTLGNERQHLDRALAARDEFLGMVAHDLRTLLGGMVMSTAALRAIPCESAARDRIERETARLGRFTTRMTRLVEDLLDVVGLEAGKLHMERAPQAADALVQETLDAFEADAVARGISLRGDASSGSVLGAFDRERVLQVLANLVGNAIKFTPIGGHIAIAAEPVDGHVRFSVADTGPGVPADKVDTIFERFEQSSRGHRRSLGLGLYIARCIVEAHRGRIWLESRPGHGSTFYFTLPMVE